MYGLRHLVTPLAGLALTIGLAGCATNNENIPPSAQMVSSGNEQVAFTAPRHGTAYVLDKNTNKMIYSGTIDKGQVVSVDPTRHDRNITIDGNGVTQTSLNVGHTYQIYFHPDDRTDRQVSVDEHVTHDRY